MYGLSSRSGCYIPLSGLSFVNCRHICSTYSVVKSSEQVRRQRTRHSGTLPNFATICAFGCTRRKTPHLGEATSFWTI